MLAGPPQGPIEIPRSVRRVAAGRSIEPVWLNQVGGLTFRLVTPSEAHYLKWSPQGCPTDLELERRKLEWARSFTSVPRVLDSGTDDEGAWLLTRAINAQNAVAPQWKLNPEKAVVAIGRGLRAMHDSLPVAECPFAWSAEGRIEKIKSRATRGLVDPKPRSPEFRGLTLEDALAMMEAPPPSASLVVCHGDACAPNTLLNDNGDWVAHVDLERLGIGERWADLAVAAWSTEWNFGKGWDGLVYDSYGIEPDQDQIKYYRLLWDLD
jgi:kanamycin kinase